MALRESNEAAFYGLLAQDLPGYLPLVYTPTVGQACQSWSKLLPRPTGLYISANDQVLAGLKGRCLGGTINVACTKIPPRASRGGWGGAGGEGGAYIADDTPHL